MVRIFNPDDQSSMDNSPGAQRRRGAGTYAHVEFADPAAVDVAVARLNDDSNWRAGLRVKALRRRRRARTKSRGISFNDGSINEGNILASGSPGGGGGGGGGGAVTSAKRLTLKMPGLEATRVRALYEKSF